MMSKSCPFGLALTRMNRVISEEVKSYQLETVPIILVLAFLNGLGRWENCATLF